MAQRPAAVAALPREPGIYRFRDAAGRVLYVGRAGDLRSRVGSYWGDLGDRRHLARMIPRIARLEALVCDSAHEAAWAERNLLQQRLPRWNRTPGGLENPVFIRVDHSPTTAGLAVVHAPSPGSSVHHFGPYLGGNQARLAIRGLHRAFPLAGTRATLTPAERDLARVRGGPPRSRQELAGAVGRVLGREPAAVDAARAALVARRDAAAAAERFEAAGLLQAELTALDWVVAPQKVTVLDGGAADHAGWAEGVLVRLRVRDGRLCGWEQRAGPQTACGAAECSPAWASFVQRNAELAAALTAQS